MAWHYSDQVRKAYFNVLLCRRACSCKLGHLIVGISKAYLCYVQQLQFLYKTSRQKLSLPAPAHRFSITTPPFSVHHTYIQRPACSVGSSRKFENVCTACKQWRSRKWYQPTHLPGTGVSRRIGKDMRTKETSSSCILLRSCTGAVHVARQFCDSSFDASDS